jgi:DNA-binding FrmR family transcriptional regulator
MSHTATSSDELIVRVRKIAGQVAAVERALTSDAPCADVLHRVAAVRGAVNGLLDEIIAAHLEVHVASPGLSDAARAQGAEELLAVIRRYAK